MAEQLHQGGKADAEAEHLRGEGVAQPVRRRRTGAAYSFGRVGQCPEEGLIQGVMAPGTRQQETLGLCQAGGWRQRAQGNNAGHHPLYVILGQNQALGVQLAQRDMQRPLVRPDLPETVQGEIDTFADADSGGAGEPERVSRQVIGPAQFLWEKLVVLGREGLGSYRGRGGKSSRRMRSGWMAGPLAAKSSSNRRRPSR